jgi:hypothetical protein
MDFFLANSRLSWYNVDIREKEREKDMTTMIQVGKVFKVYGYKNGRKVLLGTFKTSDAGIRCMNAYAS